MPRHPNQRIICSLCIKAFLILSTNLLHLSQVPHTHSGEVQKVPAPETMGLQARVDSHHIPFSPNGNCYHKVLIIAPPCYVSKEWPIHCITTSFALNSRLLQDIPTLDQSVFLWCMNTEQVGILSS